MQAQLDPVRAMQSITDMLTAAANSNRQHVAATALEAIMPQLDGVLTDPDLQARMNDSVKDPFKAYTLAVLSLCIKDSPHEQRVLGAARQAFCCRPYWFMMALTDALERAGHPSLVGAVHFGNTSLLDSSDSEQTFLVRSQATRAVSA